MISIIYIIIEIFFVFNITITAFSLLRAPVLCILVQLTTINPVLLVKQQPLFYHTILFIYRYDVITHCYNFKMQSRLIGIHHLGLCKL